MLIALIMLYTTPAIAELELKINDIKAVEDVQEFRNNRLIIANRLAALNPNPNPMDSTGFPIGYQETSDEVLISSYLLKKESDLHRLMVYLVKPLRLRVQQ